MKNIFIIVIISIFISCTQSEFDMKMSADADVNINNMEIKGQTNLENDAMININLKPLYSAEVFVSDGKFSHIFDFEELGLENGEYTLEIIYMPSKNKISKFKNMILLENDDVFEQDGEKYYYIGNNFNIGYMISKHELKELKGKKFPYDKWDVWGTPETIDDKSNNTFWVAYLNKADITLVSKKIDDEIVFVARGKVNAESFFEEREELIKSSFSAWDGSHVHLNSKIKKMMNNPKSFEHVETRYVDYGDYLVVQTSFRGANAFGGIVLDSIEAKVALDGHVLEIISE